MPVGRLNARRLGLIALGVLLIHALLLRGAHEALTAPDRAAPRRPLAALNVRTVAPGVPARTEPAVVPSVANGAPQLAARVVPPAPQRPAALTESSHRPPALTVLPTAPASRGRAEAPPSPSPAVADASSIVSAASVEAPVRPIDDLPIYRTLPPPAFAFSYDLRRGALTGNAELRWHPQGDRYQVRLAGTSDGKALLAWESVGAFDSAGLAPARYTDRRRGSSTQAANFVRDASKVTFSGPAIEHALPPGAQDRLSWMLQLAAIAAADPSLVGPGGRVTFLVVGARGDADVWTFVHVGEEALAHAELSTPTLRLLREPRRPYDARAEVWLDPARHFLPVRARLSNGAERDEIQLLLREVLPPP